MTYSPSNKELARKIDDLPDEIIKRLDDRYLKQVDAAEEYISRRDGGVIAGFLTLAAVIAGAVATIWGAFKH